LDPITLSPFYCAEESVTLKNQNFYEFLLSGTISYWLERIEIEFLEGLMVEIQNQIPSRFQ
ncbi:hypothetical protein D1AOALGA4SA_3535, partial [Olavius algarvensis Delta 1 endosymbiont]